jgi:predicted nucleic acid-binding protein
MTKSTTSLRGAELASETAESGGVWPVLMRRERRLLDTTILVDALRGRQAALKWLDEMEERPSLSVVSLTDVYSGARNRREERQIAELEAFFRWLPVTIDIARGAGVFLRRYEKGHGIDAADALIAATAEHHGLDLATLQRPTLSNVSAVS